MTAIRYELIKLSLILIALLPATAYAVPLQSPLLLPAHVTVGSKKFTESVILGEILTQLIGRGADIEATHRRELGGTRVLWQALLGGDIDLYVEYTGTITKEILAGQGIEGRSELIEALSKYGVAMSRGLGFSNNYALGMRRDVARSLRISAISDLRLYPKLVIGFTNEFMDRKDGWPGLRTRYDLGGIQDVKGIDHDLAYRALLSGSIDITDLYSTDAEIKKYEIAVLKDDLDYFGGYNAVVLYRKDLRERAPRAITRIKQLEGSIDEGEMIKMNYAVRFGREPESKVAGEFLKNNLSIRTHARDETVLSRLIENTLQHLFLVVVSLGAAILVSIPLGIAAVLNKRIGSLILGVVGVVQTIPSLALLVFMIPLLGIGAAPAIVALFLYSLLPIVRNTYSGLNDIPIELKLSAEALGLPRGARLRLVELPLATRSILAGIKTSAVINVGTATLGALIGAGGYGQPILTGIRLYDTGLILQGAIPAAVLALGVQGLFGLVESRLLPRGLKIKSESE